MAMSEKRKEQMRVDVRDREIKRVEDQYGEPKTYTAISPASLKRAARKNSANKIGRAASERQESIEKNRDERQRKARVARAKVKLAEKAAAKREPAKEAYKEVNDGSPQDKAIAARDRLDQASKAYRDNPDRSDNRKLRKMK